MYRFNGRSPEWGEPLGLVSYRRLCVRIAVLFGKRSLVFSSIDVGDHTLRDREQNLKSCRLSQRLSTYLHVMLFERIQPSQYLESSRPQS